MVTLPKFLRYLALCIILLAVTMYLTSCSKHSDTPAIPGTYEVRVEGINADGTSAGYSPISTFQVQ